MSSNERSGWRDENLSRRHREWGVDLPAVDIDCLMVEYDQAKDVAIIEYKHESAQLQDPRHPSYRAIRSLATKAGIPFFAVRYSDKLDSFFITAMNGDAEYLLQVKRKGMTEAEYVEFLYWIRGRTPPHTTHHGSQI